MRATGIGCGKSRNGSHQYCVFWGRAHPDCVARIWMQGALVFATAQSGARHVARRKGAALIVASGFSLHKVSATRVDPHASMFVLLKSLLEERRMAFEVPALPYAYEALEPHIDAQTMHLHHDKHHQ